MHYDILIIGQGLAGSLLAWQLHHAGTRILVVDGGSDNASRVAAGLVTPVTGKRWVKTPGVDELLPEARSCYHRLETEFGTRFWFEHPLLRLYRNAAERQLVQRRLREPGYQDYLGEELAPGEAGYGLADTHGSRWLQQSAHLATVPLLDHLRRWLQQRDAFLQMSLNLQDLTLTRNGIHWSGLQAAAVIFCEGWRVIKNPWFASLPWQPSRGQILTLRCQPPLPAFPVNRGIWLLPEDAHHCRLGATYRWQPLTTAPDPQERQQLLGELTHLFQQPPRVTVSGEAAGIRPNTLDHRPIVGRHPRHPQLLICNGLGSKGSLLAPGICRHLSEHLLHGTPLPAEISLQRYHVHCLD